MNRLRAIRGAALAVFLIIVPLTQADGCHVNPAPSSGSGASAQAPAPQITVKASPAATNPGVGAVSGACHFSVKGPGADTTNGSGLKPKKVGKDSYDLAGIVWGYCTDVVHDFVIDLYVYGAPIGATSSGDLYHDSKAHQLVHRAAHSPTPGPVPYPYAISMPCIPGLQLQLVWFVSATDEAGNLIGGGPGTGQVYGGKIVSFTASDCTKV
jgi:hypothetical protein